MALYSIEMDFKSESAKHIETMLSVKVTKFKLNARLDESPTPLNDHFVFPVTRQGSQCHYNVHTDTRKYWK